MRQDPDEALPRFHFQRDGKSIVVYRHGGARRRMPRAAEISRMVARGTPVTMVRDEEVEWRVMVDGQYGGTLKRLLSGRFGFEHRPLHSQELRTAAVEVATILLARRRGPGPLQPAPEATPETPRP